MSRSELISLAYVDLTQVNRALADIELRGRVMGPAMRELRKPLRADQTDHRKRAEGPDGAWPRRSPETEARRKSTNRRFRRTKAMNMIAPKKFRRRSTPAALLGRLPRAIKITAGNLFVRAESRAVRFGGSHNKGAMVGRHRRVKLPRREFLWLSDVLLKDASAIMTKYILKGW